MCDLPSRSMVSDIGYYALASYWKARMNSNVSDSALATLKEIMAVKRSSKVELNEGEYKNIFSHLRTILPLIATHWHLIIKNKKVVGCSVYTKVQVPTQKLGTASMKFNVDFRLPAKVSAETAQKVYEELFANVLMKESASDESASKEDVEAGLESIGL